MLIFVGLQKNNLEMFSKMFFLNMSAKILKVDLLGKISTLLLMRPFKGLFRGIWPDFKIICLLPFFFTLLGELLE